MIATATSDLDVEGRIAAIHDVANPDEFRAIAGGTAYDVGTW
ncbi:hypothetical protein [Saccharopolyspora sp. NPDC002376]